MFCVNNSCSHQYALRLTLLQETSRQGMAGLLILFTVLKKRGFSLFLQLATLLFENDEELKFLFAL